MSLARVERKGSLDLLVNSDTGLNEAVRTLYKGSNTADSTDPMSCPGFSRSIQGIFVIDLFA
jgi:hypothetical protein